MDVPHYIFTKLAKEHNKASFDCGIPQLNQYIAEQAGQDMKRHVAITYVLSEQFSDEIMGYHTLSATNIELKNLSNQEMKKLPRYPLLPATLIGRLAIDIKYQKKGIGQLVLMHALKLSLENSNQIASMATIVEAKNDKAIQFYKHFGFSQFPDTPNKLYLSMGTVLKMGF